ncbi:MAG: pseudouridine-5'-phosphate glycosidase [Actinomycetota bacterium]
MSGPAVAVGAEVAAALEAGRPVVALESTIFSELGLPGPANREALDRVLATVGAGGAVPALTAVLAGLAVVGVDPAEHARICGPATKVAARDLGPAIGQRWDYGATTVSASVTLAAAAGVEVFSTGGIGGVHQGWTTTGDVSADLPALADHQVITVTAGAKVFLDLPATLEYLETASVPVIGWRCDEFPAFHAPSSGLPLTTRADSAAEVAAIARAHWALGGGGIVVAVPVPEGDGIPIDELQELVDRALAASSSDQVSGAAVTPAVLARMGELSGGRTVTANLALADNNARVAAEIANALAAMPVR